MFFVIFKGQNQQLPKSTTFLYAFLSMIVNTLHHLIQRNRIKLKISEAAFINYSADLLLFFAYGRQNFRFL